MAETLEFQTEVKELLNLMIHSLYSNREIFIRELVSNSADALDKLRFESISKPELAEAAGDFRIDIRLDAENKTLHISDNGIGMNHDDLIENLGTIARSGTRKFMNNLNGEQKHDMNLIGQFGVGFYSVFMAASKVEVLTRKAGEEQAWKWSSEGTGEFSLEESSKEKPGTEIIAYLKDEEENQEFLQDWKIRGIIKKYSEYVTHPIYLHTMEQEYDDKGKEKGDPKPKEEQLNDKPALWRRSKSDVTDEQYQEFFSHLEFNGSKALAWSHNHVEGVQEYHSLLYVPEKAPFGLFNQEQKHGLKLYVRRVFIMDDCKDILPNWLRFARGVIDSEDLPLNVSREILQSNKIIAQIKKHTTKKILDLLVAMAKDEPTKYAGFWKEMGNVLKEGFYMNWEYQDELKSLLRFQSSFGKSADDLTSLEEYVKRMPSDQKEIYFITGESRSAAENSPHVESIRSRGWEILYMIDPIDEWVAQSVTEFDSKSLRNITMGDLGLEKTEEEKKEEEEKTGEYKKVLEKVKEILGDKIGEVRVSSRLKDSPCCLVSKADGISANMEKILKMSNQNFGKNERDLEINPDHPLVLKLNQSLDQQSEAEEWVDVLYNQAVLAEGGDLEKPGEFVKKMNALLVKAIG